MAATCSSAQDYVRYTGVIVCRLVLICSLCFLVASPATAGRSRKKKRRPRYGFLKLTTKTKGATVEVDGEGIGTTPLVKPIRIDPGKHTLKIAKKGYTEYLDVFVIKRGKATALGIDLLPVAGILSVDASVDHARVHVDGKYVGTTPLEIEALIGKRTVRIVKEGYHDVVLRPMAIAGRRTHVSATLIAMPVGSSPYRPPPPPPKAWYEKWYVWAGIVGGTAVIATGILVPVLLTSGDPVEDFGADFRFSVR